MFTCVEDKVYCTSVNFVALETGTDKMPTVANICHKTAVRLLSVAALMTAGGVCIENVP